MLTRDKLIRALQARGKSDQLAQMAADPIECLCETAHPEPTPAPGPDGIFLTERVRELERDAAHMEARIIRQITEPPAATPPIDSLFSARKAPAKKAAAKREGINLHDLTPLPG